MRTYGDIEKQREICNEKIEKHLKLLTIATDEGHETLANIYIYI